MLSGVLKTLKLSPVEKFGIANFWFKFREFLQFFGNQNFSRLESRGPKSSVYCIRNKQKIWKLGSSR